MAQRNQNQFIKRKKEMERKQKAIKKMAKRQGKNNQTEEPATNPTPDQPSQTQEG